MLSKNVITIPSATGKSMLTRCARMSRHALLKNGPHENSTTGKVNTHDAQRSKNTMDLTPEQVKEILTSTADPLPRFGKMAQGAGMVDPDEAISQALYRAVAAHAGEGGGAEPSPAEPEKA